VRSAHTVSSAANHRTIHTSSADQHVLDILHK